jgi:hypothetical protein
VLLAIRFRALIVPVDDSLVRNDVGIVQDFDDLRESLENPGFLIAVYLDTVDQAHFSFGTVTECLQDRSMVLMNLEIRTFGSRKKTHGHELNSCQVRLVTGKVHSVH